MDILFLILRGHPLLGKFKLAHINRTFIWLICSLLFIDFAKLSVLLDLINFQVDYSILNLGSFTFLQSELLSSKVAALHEFIDLQLALNSVKFGLGCSIKINLFLNQLPVFIWQIFSLRSDLIQKYEYDQLDALVDEPAGQLHFWVAISHESQNLFVFGDGLDMHDDKVSYCLDGLVDVDGAVDPETEKCVGIDAFENGHHRVPARIGQCCYLELETAVPEWPG